jgi:hypothetical protein
MKKIIFALFFPICIYGQSLKSALDKQDYNEVIRLLKDSLLINPNDSKLYCDLGHYYHYRAYDWRPLIGYKESYSDSVLYFLEKAISLNSDYREPFYWLHAQYGARATEAIENNQITKYKHEYQSAKDKGAMPKWLLEFARNTLNSCDSDAILFTYGDLTLNAISYIQLFENHRKDVSVIPIGFCGSPSEAKLHKYGIKNIIKPVKIRFSDDQIMGMKPYPWDTLDVKVKFSSKLKHLYDLETDYFTWRLAPDMTSKGSTYMSPWLALFAEIIEANQFERPIYFSIGFREEALAGLLPYTINCGIVYKLVPFITKGSVFEMDTTVFEKVLLNKSSFVDFKDVEVNNFPDNSQILLNYHFALWQLSEYYKKMGIKNKTAQLKDFIRNYVSSDILKTDTYLNGIKD